VLDAEGSSRVLREIIWPALRGLAAEGRPFRGVLYAGLMVTDLGPKVLEFNARFGDPETEVILPRIVSDLAAVLAAATARGELEAFSPLEVKAEVCAGVVLCSAGYPGVSVGGKVISGLTEAARVPGVELFHAHTEQEGDRLLAAGGRVIVVTATAPSLTDALGRAYEAANRIDFDGKHFRRDIGSAGLRARI
jgi:phosphoribosylamine--glycine ligase